MFEGTERFFGRLRGQPDSLWIPRLTRRGGPAQGRRRWPTSAAASGLYGDHGTGLPGSTFVGVDYTRVDRAGPRPGREAGVDRVEFRWRRATWRPMTSSRCSTACTTCRTRSPRCGRPGRRGDHGRVMLVEPMSWDTVAEALNPLGAAVRASLLICLPSGLSAEAGGRPRQPGRPGADRALASRPVSPKPRGPPARLQPVYELRPEVQSRR